jgi:hypothetical protein
LTGFVRMERSALEHPLLKDGDRFRAWFWMVAKACWKPTRFDVHGKVVTLERGQFCVSVREMAEAWGWSKSAVDRFVQRLVDEDMVISVRAKTGTGNGTASGTGRSVITICNYDKYQDKTEKTGTGSEPRSGTVAGQQRDIKEQGNKGTIEPNGSTPLTPHRDSDWIDLPDWLPAEPWNGWLEMRADKRKWPTPRAVKLTIDKLTRWRGKGHDPGEVLDNATENTWTTIYEPKEPRNGQRSFHQRPTTRETGERLAARFAAAGGGVVELLPGPRAASGHDRG